MIKTTMGYWINELKTLVKSPWRLGIWAPDPAKEITREISRKDYFHTGLLIALSFVFSGIQLLVRDEKWKPLAQFFGTPIQFIIILSFLSVFLWIGSHFNRAPIKLLSGFKAALRVMSVFPLLQVLLVFKIGPILILAVIGFFAVKTAVNFLKMPQRNAVVFYGAVYTMFIMMQMKAVFFIS